jgi:hypothetical protein
LRAGQARPSEVLAGFGGCHRRARSTRSGWSCHKTRTSVNHVSESAASSSGRPTASWVLRYGDRQLGVRSPALAVPRTVASFRVGAAQAVVDSSTMLTSSGARSVRSAAFAVSAVGLSLGAHVTAGGEIPVVPLLLLLVAHVDAASSAFARRPRGPIATAVALLTAQVVLHGAFMVAAPAHAAHTHDIHSPRMLVAHGIAASVLAVLLSRGEQLIANVARVLLPVALLRPFRPLPASRLVVAVPSDVPPMRLAATLHDLSRRGPPDRSPAART